MDISGQRSCLLHMHGICFCWPQTVEWSLTKYKMQGGWPTRTVFVQWQVQHCSCRGSECIFYFRKYCRTNRKPQPANMLLMCDFMTHRVAVVTKLMVLKMQRVTLRYSPHFCAELFLFSAFCSEQAAPTCDNVCPRICGVCLLICWCLRQ